MGEDHNKEKPNSVKFAINGKGVWPGEVKVYEESIEIAYKKAVTWAKEMEQLLRDKNE